MSNPTITSVELRQLSERQLHSDYIVAIRVHPMLKVAIVEEANRLYGGDSQKFFREALLAHFERLEESGESIRLPR